MQGTFTPIFVRFHLAVFENECPSIHGVREYIAYSIRENRVFVLLTGVARRLLGPHDTQIFKCDMGGIK